MVNEQTVANREAEARQPLRSLRRYVQPPRYEHRDSGIRATPN